MTTEVLGNLAAILKLMFVCMVSIAAFTHSSIHQVQYTAIRNHITAIWPYCSIINDLRFIFPAYLYTKHFLRIVVNSLKPNGSGTIIIILTGPTSSRVSKILRFAIAYITYITAFNNLDSLASPLPPCTPLVTRVTFPIPNSLKSRNAKIKFSKIDYDRKHLGNHWF